MAQKKTYAEHAQDALYREVWEDVNNDKTTAFLKRYSRALIAAAAVIVIAAGAIQLWRHNHAQNQIATAAAYDTAFDAGDAAALAAISENSSGAMADMALYQAWMIGGDAALLERLASDGDTRDFRDLARLHLAGIQGDKMTADAFADFMSPLDTKSSPYYYDGALLVAQKYLASGDADNAAKFLDKITGDDNAPAVIRATAEGLK